jgi:hypothetical protein
LSGLVSSLFDFAVGISRALEDENSNSRKEGEISRVPNSSSEGSLAALFV